MTTDNKRLAGWFFTGFGLIVISVGSYFGHTVTALATGLEHGFGTVTRMYRIEQGSNRAVDYRVDVTVGVAPQNSRSAARSNRVQLTVDISKSEFNALTEGSQLAVAWQRSKLANNFGGNEVLPLVRGTMTEAEFIQQQEQKVVFGLYCGVGILMLGVLTLVRTRAGSKDR